MSEVIENNQYLDKKLKIACEAMGVVLSSEKRQKLIDYLNNLLKWNKTYNLTAIRNPEQGLIHHIFDSLSVVAPLKKYFEIKKIEAPKIMDVGSGGGLPGSVLAIALDQARITCVDTVEKKTSFIRQMASVLKLNNLEAIHSRVENIEPAHADLVISRAFASLEDFADLSGRHVKQDGILVGMKGKNPGEEIEALINKGQWKIEKIESLLVPELQADRCLVWMERKGRK